MADQFAESIEYAQKCLKINFDLSYHQLKALKSLYTLKDTVAVLPTGSGKSVIFQILPWLLQKPLKSKNPLTVIIISPLNSLMQDQVTSLCEKGISACFLNIDATKVSTVDLGNSKDYESDSSLEDSPIHESPILSNETIEDIKQGKYNIVYMHPESVFNHEVGLMLRSKFRHVVCCTVVDEVHMISEWGTDFRKYFDRVGELTCLFPNIPHLALTATATPDAINSLIEALQFRETTRIIANPDRPNIFIEKREKLSNLNKYEKCDVIMNKLTKEITDEILTFPVTILYFDNLESLGYCFQYILHKLGKDAYFPVGSSDPEDRIVAQFHKDYTPKMKSHIINELRKENPKVRLVLATVALGMGLNAPSISRLMHMRPPTTLEKYLQEIGRADRNGQKAVAVCYFNSSDIARNRKGLHESMRQYVLNNVSCLRLQLLQHFGYDKTLFIGDPTNCSNCRSAAENQLCMQ